MDRQDGFNGLDLKYQLVFDNKISSESSPQINSPIENRNLNLPFSRDLHFGKLLHQGKLIDRFQQPRPQFSMNIDGCSYHTLNQVLVTIFVFSVLSVSSVVQSQSSN